MRSFFFILFAAFCVHFGWKQFSVTTGPVAGADPDVAGIAKIAATVKPEEVVMYSTTECVYCAQAKGWLQQNGFAYYECNMSVSPECERQFRSYGANGTPFLLVRGNQMKDGFDSDEFLSLLK